MAQQRLPVRKVREVLRVKAAGFSDRTIAATIASAVDRRTGRKARTQGYPNPARVFGLLLVFRRAGE